VITTQFDRTGEPFRYLVEDRFGRVVGEAFDLANDQHFTSLPSAEVWLLQTDWRVSDPLAFV
jgi:hypothetical protein